MPQLPAKREKKYSDKWEATQIERFDRLLELDLSTLLRESSTEFNFLEIKSRIQNIIQQVTLISENYDFWEQLADGMRANLNASFDDMLVQFDSMLKFDPKQNNAWDERNNIVANFAARYNSFYSNVIAPLSAFLGVKAYSEELSSEFGARAKEELDEIRRVKKEIEKAQVDVNQALNVVGNKAIGAQASTFASQATEHETSASNWFKGLIAVSIPVAIIAVLVVVDIFRGIIEANFVTNIQAYVLKAAILAVLYALIRFIIRNYVANKHLYIINKHRSNTLASMEALRDSAIAESAKDTILLAAVSSAYSQQETGFITRKEGAGSEPSDVVDIVKTVLPNK